MDTSRKVTSLSLWWFFAYFMILNSVLSFCSLSNGLKFAMAALGLLFPLAFAALVLPRDPGKPVVFGQEFLAKIPHWFWAFLVLADLLLRITRLDQPWLGWLKGDEGLNGLYAIGLSERWEWRYFYYSGQFPAPFLWLSGILFRWVQNPFLALWLPSAILSAALAPLSYLVLRRFFSKSFSLVGAAFWVFSLWDFALGRMSFSSLVIPWEMGCLYLGGVFLQENTPSRKIRWAALLGVAIGSGYLVTPMWPFFALLAFLVVLGEADARSFLCSKLAILVFGCSFLAALLPLGVLIANGDYSLSNRFFSSFGTPVSMFQRLRVVFSYFSSFFWGALKGVEVFFPENMERFNPLWGAAFFVGCLQWVRARSLRFSGWLALTFLVFFLPVFVSVYVEMLRVMTWLPLLLGVATWGLSCLLMEIGKEKRLAALLLFLGFSAAVDGARVWVFHHDPTGTILDQTAATVDLGSQRTYEILKSISKQKGPGLLFTEFPKEGNDHTVFVSTYDFNAAENPRLDSNKASWAAIRADRHYYPFLARRFPKAKWYDPGRDLPQALGALVGVMEVDGKNRRIFQKWIPVHHYFLKMHRDVGNISTAKNGAFAHETLQAGEEMAKGDRFLEASYWEFMADYYYQYGYQVHYNDLIHALQEAILSGYPAEHLYYKLGSLYLRKKNLAGARQAFRAALRLEPNNEDLYSALSLLSRMEKNSSYPSR